MYSKSDLSEHLLEKDKTNFHLQIQTKKPHKSFPNKSFEIISVRKSKKKISFDETLKFQIANFKYIQKKEILNENTIFSNNDFSLSARTIRKNDIMERTPRFDITNKFINLLINDHSFLNFSLYSYIISILIRVYLFGFFIYNFLEENEFSLYCLLFFNIPRFLFAVLMVKIFCKSESDDIYFNRISQGFNSFDDSSQNSWFNDIHYDFYITLGEMSYMRKGPNLMRNLKSKLSDKNKSILKRNLKGIIKRIILIVTPIELLFLVLYIFFKKQSNHLKTIKILVILAEWMYRGLEIIALILCLVAMGMKEGMENGFLHYELNFERVSWLILFVPAFFYIILAVYLFGTKDKKAENGRFMFALF